ncbi:hypothetical protein CSW98_05455 [Vibrio sp. HA2012]|nr:hypothetical protein CSW98_05455 [Vibrio sp. HA2012]
MGYDIAAVYVSHIIANEMLYEMMYGKNEPKKVSLFSKIWAFFK